MKKEIGFNLAVLGCLPNLSKSIHHLTLFKLILVHQKLYPKSKHTAHRDNGSGIKTHTMLEPIEQLVKTIHDIVFLFFPNQSNFQPRR